jgi:hypothetical protein
VVPIFNNTIRALAVPSGAYGSSLHPPLKVGLVSFSRVVGWSVSALPRKRGSLATLGALRSARRL